MKRKISAILAACTLFTGCSSSVEQINDSFSAYLLSGSTMLWYVNTTTVFTEQHPEAEVDVDLFDADAYDLLNPREYRDTSTAKLQEYYDTITNGLRTDTVGDFVIGDALYIDWPGVSPPDWQKMMRNDAFAAVSAESGIMQYAKRNSSGSAFAGDAWHLVPLTYRPLIVYTSAEMAQKWNFDFTDTANGDPMSADTILEFLEKCAAWVERYGTDPTAPSIMPDYEYRRLKALVFDLCGVDITNYSTGTVDFDNDTVKRLLEAMKMIGTDIEDSGIGDQGELFFEEEAAEAQRYLICDGYLFGGERMSMILLDVNRKHQCLYATRWAAIPAASENQALAQQYLETLLQDETAYRINTSICQMYNESPVSEQEVKTMNIVIPNGWQYALSELFDEYYAGHMETDEFALQVQQRLRAYITE